MSKQGTFKTTSCMAATTSSRVSTIPIKRLPLKHSPLSVHTDTHNYHETLSDLLVTWMATTDNEEADTPIRLFYAKYVRFPDSREAVAVQLYVRERFDYANQLLNEQSYHEAIFHLCNAFATFRCHTPIALLLEHDALRDRIPSTFERRKREQFLRQCARSQREKQFNLEPDCPVATADSEFLVDRKQAVDRWTSTDAGDALKRLGEPALMERSYDFHIRRFRTYSNAAVKAANNEEATQPREETAEQLKYKAVRFLLRALICYADKENEQWPQSLREAFADGGWLKGLGQYKEKRLIAIARERRHYLLTRLAVQESERIRTAEVTKQKKLLVHRAANKIPLGMPAPRILHSVKTFEEILAKSTLAIDRSGIAVDLMAEGYEDPEHQEIDSHNVVLTVDKNGKTVSLGTVKTFCEMQVDSTTGEQRSRYDYTRGDDESDEGGEGATAEIMEKLQLKEAGESKSKLAWSTKRLLPISTTMEEESTSRAKQARVGSGPASPLSSPSSISIVSEGKRTRFVQLECSARFGEFGQFEAERNPAFLARSYLNHAVVQLDFSFLKAAEYKGFVGKFLRLIQAEFTRHEERGLLTRLEQQKSSAKTEKSKKKIQKKIDLFQKYDEMELSDTCRLDESLADLCSLLNEAYNAGRGNIVILLIDNLTAPMDYAWAVREKENIANFLGAVLDLAKDHVLRTLAVGSLYLPIPFSSYFANGVHNVMDNRLERHFMLREEVFEELAEAYKLPDSVRAAATSSYNGFEVGNLRENKRRVRYYNLFSILNFLSEKTLHQRPTALHALRDQWVANAPLERYFHFFSFPRVQIRLKELVAERLLASREGGRQEMRYKVSINRSNFSYADLTQLNSIGNQRDLNNSQIDTLFRLLTANGYLSMASDYDSPGHPTVIVCPNDEIRRDIAKRISSFYTPAQSEAFDAVCKEFTPFINTREGWNLEKFFSRFTAFLRELNAGGAGASQDLAAIHRDSVPAKYWNEAIIKYELLSLAYNCRLLATPEQITRGLCITGDDQLLLEKKLYGGDRGTFNMQRRNNDRLIHPDDRAATSKDGYGLPIGKTSYIDLWIIDLLVRCGLIWEVKWLGQNAYVTRDAIVQALQCQPPEGYPTLNKLIYLATRVHADFHCSYISLIKEKRDGKWVTVEGSLRYGSLETC